jgi:hypothetical protein
MTFPRLLFFIGVFFVVLLVGAIGVTYWYLFPPVEVDAAELVPGNTIFFATIPNATNVLAGYESSQLKTLVESPNSEPLRTGIVNYIGQKNADLIQAFLPNMSGQSFIAVTHFDYDKPQEAGLIAGVKPKAGLSDFDAFLSKLKATWPELLAQGKTGTGTVEGVDYEWIQGPGAADKICVARVKGWIITTWGEATLQDWLQRFHKKPTTSSLADDVEYRKAVATVGDNPTTMVYVSSHALLDAFQKETAKTNPDLGNYLSQKLAAFTGAAVAARFDNGAIVDHFSLLIPRQTQLDLGMTMDPCPFETLKFTGPDTAFYWGSSINWKQFYDSLRQEPSLPATISPAATGTISFLQNWVHANNIDTEQNIINALGSEVSVQVEWSQDATYPEAGLFVKVDKPDDFKPVITAIIESVRQAYANSGVVKELKSGGQSFASLEFVQSSFYSPTITEDGPYFGIFLTENQAVRSFQRDPSIGLTHNASFDQQTGDKRKTAAQVFFLDSPRLLNRGYQTVLPYLSLAQMFNKDVAAALKGRQMPADLSWLAPVGAWSCVITPDEESIEGYSVSGVGNQGIPLAAGLYQGVNLLQGMGFFPKVPAPPPPPPPLPTPTPPMTLPDATTNSASAPATPTDATTAATNAAPVMPNAATNSAPTNNVLPTPVPVNTAPLQPQQ